MAPESKAAWTSVRVRPTLMSEEANRACLAALFAVGAQGVHEDNGTLVTHFPPGTSLTIVHAALSEADLGVAIETSPVDDVDWSEAWKSRIVAHQLGPLMVAPPWLAEGTDLASTIVIDPGMAFGTGDHATTRGVIRLLPAVLQQGDVVADLGCGSAILAIAAAKLGASRVYAVELDGEAIPDAERNVMTNAVADRVHVFEADAGAMLPLLAPVRLILANIISSVLIELLPTIASVLAPNGAAVLSGILLDERETMLAILSSTGWRVAAEDSEGIWWSVSIVRA